MGVYNHWFSICFGIRQFITKQVKQLKEDERGLEVVQMLLILLIIVIIAAAVWGLLKDFIADLLVMIRGA